MITESLISADWNTSTSINDENVSKLMESARKDILKKYQRWKKNILEFEPEDIQELYLSTLTQMFDPHTSFLNVKEKEKFDQNMHNEFVGIGRPSSLIMMASVQLRSFYPEALLKLQGS